MPYPYSRRELTRDAALTPADFQQIKRRRGEANRLGFAYQIGFVRLLNRFPAQQPFELIDELLSFTAIQIDGEPDRINDYAHRQHTVSDHQSLIRTHLGLALLEGSAEKQLQTFLFDEACRLEQSSALLSRAQQFLRAQGILQPADSTLIRLVGEQRKVAREQIAERITSGLGSELINTLDALLVVEVSATTSALQKIKANPKKPSADAILALTNKLATIEATGATEVDLSWLNNNYQRSLFHYVRHCSADRLRNTVAPRRYASLICFLWQSYQDGIDQCIDMVDKLLTRTQSQVKFSQLQALQKQRQSIKASLSTFCKLGEIALDTAIEPINVREHLFKVISQEDLATQIEAITDWTTGKHSDVLPGVIQRYSFLRRFTPAFINSIRVTADDPEHSCVEALTLLRELNEGNKRTVPDDATLAFVPKSARKWVIVDQGKISKRAWETVLLLKVRDEIRAGNLNVARSKRFGHFDEFFIPKKHWDTRREAFFQRAGLPSDSAAVPEYLSERMGQAFDVYQHQPDAVESTKQWKVPPTPAVDKTSTQSADIDRLKSWLQKNMRHIRLPELLIEIDNELGFTRPFMTPLQHQNRQPEDIRVVLAAIMARGCNIGPYTMAQLIPGISYRQLKKVNDWQMNEEAQRAALAIPVNAIAASDVSLYWGEGKTSASDGQRFGMSRKVLQQTYSPRYSDFALEFYTFIADNYAPFYSTPIECTARDSGYVLDGLCYNESDLELEEHYVDTHGYSQINFTAFTMLGRRFCPRIRGVHKSRLFCMDRERDYGALNDLLKKKNSVIDPQVIAEQWDRMGQFYTSLELGHTTASVALKRLAGFKATNRFYRANRDLGRLLQTEFILKFMTELPLRQRIQRGLLKIEQMHALARDVYYGKRGRVNSHELHDQMNSCSCLTLIMACIIYWQTKEISRVISQYNPEENDINLSMLEHISPIEWENVVLYGEYVIDPDLIRPLRA